MPGCCLLSHSEFVKAVCPGDTLEVWPFSFSVPPAPPPPEKKNKNQQWFLLFLLELMGLE